MRGKKDCTATKTYKKKAYKKKAKTNTKWKNTVSVGLGFPKKMMMTHKYHTTVAHTSNVGVQAFYKFRCNSLNDPDYISGVAHKVYYFREMAAIYDHYTVIGSKITVKAIPVLASAVAYYFTLSQNDDITQTATTLDATAEQSSGSVKIVPAANNSYIPTLRNKWSAKKTFGGSILGNDNLQGTATTNPTEETFWIIGLQACDSTSTIAVYLDVTIEYIAIWDEIKDVVGST